MEAKPLVFDCMRCSTSPVQFACCCTDCIIPILADGSSDDTDMPIREVFCDKDFVAKHNLASLNSVNWGRMLVQIAHHFYAYYQASEMTTLISAVK